MRISWRQYANDHPRVVDVALIVLLLCGEGALANLNSSLPNAVSLGWRSAMPLTVAPALALLWRRDHPRVVVVFTALCAGATGVVGYLITPVNLAPVMIALYELAVRVPGPTARRYCLGVTALTVLTALLGNRYGYPWVLVVLNPILFLLLPVALGTTARLRQAHQEDEARHRVAEERVRIARELHDVVAHHLALANAQAGTAAYLAPSHPEKVRSILTELTGTTSSALRELKATVGLLRQPGDPSSPQEPAPGLGQLPRLTAAFASAGLDVAVVVDGREQPLSPEVELTAFRIVQEALTNVTKHATTRTAEVHLSYGEAWLHVTIFNDVENREMRPGFGIIGMRERAHAAGGDVDFQHIPDINVFRVRARLPILPPTS